MRDGGEEETMGHDDSMKDEASRKSSVSTASVEEATASKNGTDVPEISLRGIDPIQGLKHVLFALVAGAICGLGSVVLCIVVRFAFDIFREATWLIWFLPVMGVAQLLLYRLWKLPQDLTTHRVVMNLRNDEEVPSLLAPGILLGTATTILSGGSVGKEAGALQMGASLGNMVSKPFKLRSVFKRNKDESMNGYVAALGMAAEFSALFFAPIGSAVFVMELSRYKKSINKHIVTILIACFVAYLVSSTIGIGDYIDHINIPEMSWAIIGLCISIGAINAFFGSVFDSAIHWIHDLTWRISKNFYIWVIVGGLLYAILVNVFGWWSFTGSGGSTLNSAIHGDFEQTGFLMKLVLTLICLGFWFKGGEITPSFCIGGLLGATCASLIGADVSFGVAVGVISFFAAFSRCPLAALLMGCEIIGWDAAPFLLIAVFVSFNFSTPVGMYGDGIDKALRTKWQTAHENILNQRIKDSQEDQIGAIARTQGTLEALKKTLDDEENMTSKPTPAESAGRADGKEG